MHGSFFGVPISICSSLWAWSQPIQYHFPSQGAVLKERRIYLYNAFHILKRSRSASGPKQTFCKHSHCLYGTTANLYKSMVSETALRWTASLFIFANVDWRFTVGQGPGRTSCSSKKCSEIFRIRSNKEGEAQFIIWETALPMKHLSVSRDDLFRSRISDLGSNYLSQTWRSRVETLPEFVNLKTFTRIDQTL